MILGFTPPEPYAGLKIRVVYDWPKEHVSDRLVAPHRARQWVWQFLRWCGLSIPYPWGKVSQFRDVSPLRTESNIFMSRDQYEELKRNV